MILFPAAILLLRGTNSIHWFRSDSSYIAKTEACSGCPAVREKSGKFQTLQKSGNFVEGQGKN